MIVQVVFLAVLALQARAQIPSLGFCPDYVPMAGFDMDKFIGPWYEAERYFQLTEVASRCVMSNYTKGADGKYRVSNEVTSRFTGIKRILEGEIRPMPNNGGKIIVRYTTVPLITPETTYSVLETDYDTYAVMWSCAGVGPVHTQNAWIMTRKRLAPPEALQRAYLVLEKHKLSKTFFVKTDQDDCAYLEALPSRPVVLPPLTARNNAEGSEMGDRVIEPDAPEYIKELARNSQKEMARPQNDQPMVEEAPKAQEPAAPAMATTVEMTEAKTVPEVLMKVAEMTEMPMEKMVPEEPMMEPIDQKMEMETKA